jgi:hypothetical protein
VFEGVMDQDIEVKSYSPAKSVGQARQRAAKMLVFSTLFSLLPCALIFAAVLYGEWMTGMFKAMHDLMFGQPVWAILAATSPLAAALLVGYGYMQKAIRRRAAEKDSAIAAQPNPQANG